MSVECVKSGEMCFDVPQNMLFLHTLICSILAISAVLLLFLFLLVSAPPQRAPHDSVSHKARLHARVLHIHPRSHAPCRNVKRKKQRGREKEEDKIMPHVCVRSQLTKSTKARTVTFYRYGGSWKLRKWCPWVTHSYFCRARK